MVGALRWDVCRRCACTCARMCVCVCVSVSVYVCVCGVQLLLSRCILHESEGPRVVKVAHRSRSHGNVVPDAQLFNAVHVPLRVQLPAVSMRSTECQVSSCISIFPKLYADCCCQE